jgi:hypothetical protein
MLETILYTIGIVALIKGLFVLIFKKSITRWCVKIIKNPKNVKNLAIAEIIGAIILIIIGYLVK